MVVWTVFVVLGWTLLAILALVITIVCSPVHLVLAIEKREETRFQFELRLFSRHLPRLFHIERGSTDGEHIAAEAEEGLAKPTGENRGGRFRLSRARLIAMARDVPSVLGDTLRGIHFDRLRVRGTVGFEDPADTGEVYGYLCPFNQVFSSKRFDVCITPDFASSQIMGRAEAALHFIPARLAYPTLRFLFMHLVWRR